MSQSDRQPLVGASAVEWGSIKDVVNAPLKDVAADSSWLSIMGMWLFAPLIILAGVVIGFCQCLLVGLAIGYCCVPGSNRCASVMGTVKAGRPLYMAWIWWLYAIAGPVALVRNMGSRLGLFIYSWKAFGSGEYWWHGEGVWSWSYADCKKILMGEQIRREAFGCIRACVPDVMSEDLLIFLPNTGADSPWGVRRKLLHEFFLDQGSKAHKDRVAALPGQIAAEWKGAKLEDASAEILQKFVCKSIFYVMFGIWIEDDDAKKLMKWRSYASYFILPRVVQRFIFNILIRRVKTLREETVGLIEKYHKQEIFIAINNRLPAHMRRASAAALCDEMMFVIGFAGVGGTCALLESTISFLQTKIPAESPGEKYIKWGDFDTSEKMVKKYKEDPVKYLKETARMDPPVTSATSSLPQEIQATLNGRQFLLPAWLLNQYCIALANRDEAVFKEPSKFNPDRKELNKAFTWNGAFGDPEDEETFPRICPGRYLSLEIAKAIVNHAVGNT